MSRFSSPFDRFSFAPAPSSFALLKTIVRPMSVIICKPLRGLAVQADGACAPGVRGFPGLASETRANRPFIAKSRDERAQLVITHRDSSELTIGPPAQKATAGPSTPLRSAQDDRVIGVPALCRATRESLLRRSRRAVRLPVSGLRRLSRSLRGLGVPV